MKKKIALIGANGSVGRQSLEIIKEYSSFFDLTLATCHSHFEQLQDLTSSWDQVQLACTGKPENPLPAHFLSGKEAVTNFICEIQPDILLIASAGLTGFEILRDAYPYCAKIAIANKESLIMAGCSGLIPEIRKTSFLLPIDSEHVGIHQLISGHDNAYIRKVYLTASGGPFYSKKSDQVNWDNISPEQAMAHPTWNMGPKVSLDSATMANKGIELIEAQYLFQLPWYQLDILIQPSSQVHALVEWVDGSTTAQLAVADMRLCVQYALFWPQRKTFSHKASLDLHHFDYIPFVPFDPESLDIIKASYYCMQHSASKPWLPLVYLASDEIALERFVLGQMKFKEIGSWILNVCHNISEQLFFSYETVNPSNILGIYNDVVNAIKKGY